MNFSIHHQNRFLLFKYRFRILKSFFYVLSHPCLKVQSQKVISFLKRSQIVYDTRQLFGSSVECFVRNVDTSYRLYEL